MQLAEISPKTQIFENFQLIEFWKGVEKRLLRKFCKLLLNFFLYFSIFGSIKLVGKQPLLRITIDL